MARKKSPDRDVEQFNAIAVIGMPVEYKNDTGDIIEMRLRTMASVLGGHTAVVWLEGKQGCVDLRRVSFIAGDDDEFMGHPI